MTNLLTRDVNGYRRFLAIKSLPQYRFQGRSAWFPDEYADRIGIKSKANRRGQYTAPEWLWDYQRAIVETAIAKRKFCIFADCGLGKTPMLLEFAGHAQRQSKRPVLIVSPLMVCGQTAGECERFFGYRPEQIPARDLQSWLRTGKGVGITNYEAITDDLERGKIGGLVLDESSMLKSHYGKWGTKLIDLGRGLEWKLACTGTPAPNDRIEYANHAVFMDAFPTVNSFLAKFFVNRGQTQERWELKPHALKPFYLALSHWSIFLNNPATYGWKDNAGDLPPIKVFIHDVELSDEQKTIARTLSTGMFLGDLGGIVKRSTFGQLAKGRHKGEDVEALKPAFIQKLVGGWKESTIVWCIYNAEQEAIAKVLPDAVSIDGDTPLEARHEAINRFKAGQLKTIITKPKVLGFGLNLQRCTRMVFSGLQDSYESYYQAVKRANRYGATEPLEVHIPTTDLERPMVENVLRKAAMVQRDTEEQERIFKEAGHVAV